MLTTPPGALFLWHPGVGVSLLNINHLLAYVEPLLCAATLVMLFRRGIASDFRFVTWNLIVRLLRDTIALFLLSPASMHMNRRVHYNIYFVNYWLCFTLEVGLGFGIIYSVYRLAMAPLPGLQRLGMVVFRWAVGISLAIALAMAIGPRVTSGDYMIRFLGQLQQTESVLTLCLLLFVCVTVSPMGLSVRSRIFGVCLGFGVNAASQLVSSAWFPTDYRLNSVFSLFDGLAVCLGLGIWALYFAMPEPKRRIIMLPTTSPFLRWNQISAALGDAPGYVALGTVTQDMFAPAELEMMRRASEKMSQAYGD